MPTESRRSECVGETPVKHGILRTGVPASPLGSIGVRAQPPSKNIGVSAEWCGAVDAAAGTVWESAARSVETALQSPRLPS